MDCSDLLRQYHSGLTRRADTAPFWLTPGEYLALALIEYGHPQNLWQMVTTRYILKLMRALESIEMFSRGLCSTTTEKPEMVE